MKYRVTLIFVLLLLGCNKQRHISSALTNQPIPSVEGTWIGTLEVQNVGYSFAVTFDSTGGNLRGDMDIISSLSPNIKITNIRLDGGLISFSLPLSVRESMRFEGRISESNFSGEAVFSGDTEVRGEFNLKAATFESLPAWARGGETWHWPDNKHPYWPTEEWRTISHTSAGLDTQALSAASDIIRERFPGIHALLITRGGYLAYEEYFHGGSITEPINIKSASKGIITALVGVAIRKGNISALDQKVSALVPHYFREVEDKGKNEIRLHHLLDMTSGLNWVENGPQTAEWDRRGHSSSYYLSLPLDCIPGECFNYSTASTHLLSEIIMLKTGGTTMAFAEKNLFDPIGVEISDWWQSTSGVHIGGADLLMTARDMARVGLLMLNQGMWDGHEVIPTEWVHECVAYHSEGQPFVGSYSYGWWRRSIDSHPAFIAKGYGGQFIFVLPDSDLVVVVGSDISYPAMAPIIEHWVGKSVIPAAFLN